MKHVFIPSAALVVSMLVSMTVSMTGAQAATQCQAEIVKGRTTHWTYRLIDGRKCWYEGKAQLPKSELYWGDRKEPEAREAVQAPQPGQVPPAVQAPQAVQVPQAVRAPQAMPAPLARSVPVPPQDPRATDARASSSFAAESEPFTDPEDGSCCWPPQQTDSFEQRWRSLGLRSLN